MEEMGATSTSHIVYVIENDRCIIDLITMYE